MTNFEYYKDELVNITNSNSNIAVVDDKPRPCTGLNGTPCIKCDFDSDEKCGVSRMKWLLEEHIEKPKLTKKERMFCELVETGWIVRDENGILYHSVKKPHKSLEVGKWHDGMKWIDIYDRFTSVLYNSFSFITWDDKEPWSVEDLLKLEVMED